MKRHCRDFGLAFGSAHLVHAGLIAWLCWIGATQGTGVFVSFGPALAFVYLLALFSIPRLRQALGRTGWWLLRTSGMNYVAYAYAVDFLHAPLKGGAKHAAEYVPYAVLSVAGFAFHLASLPPVGPLRKVLSWMQHQGDRTAQFTESSPPQPRG